MNGKIFDLLGVSPAAQEASKTEPKMKARVGLVMPPDQARLPAPGADGAAVAIAGVQDPESKKMQAAAERERMHRAYCSGDLSWKERIKDPDSPPTSPYGSCTLLGKQD